MKNVTRIILCLFAFVMTAQEIGWGDLFLKYYSGELPGIARDEQKVHGYIYGDETVKKGYLKQFVINVLMPMEQANKTSIDSKAVEMDTSIKNMDSYTRKPSIP